MNIKEEERKVIETFVKQFKAFNWFVLAWRNFDLKCFSFNATKIINRIMIKPTMVIQHEYGIIKENFLDYWEMDETRKKELERIVNLDETEYWEPHFLHAFDSKEEEAMIEFLKKWEHELKAFFNIE